MKFILLPAITALLSSVVAEIHATASRGASSSELLDDNSFGSRQQILSQEHDELEAYVPLAPPVASTGSPGVYTVPMRNWANNRYTAAIQLGTPPQTFEVGIDTGSSNTWVIGMGCDMHACRRRHRYDSSVSSSYQPNGTKFSIGYGANETCKHLSFVSGFVSQDTLTFGGLQITGQDFAEATEGSHVEFDAKSEGVFGMSYDIAAVNDIVPPFYHMMARKMVKEPMFAFYHSDVRNGDSDISEITLGGVNTNHFDGELIKLPVRRYGTWEVEVNAISLGSETIETGTAGMAIDTGSSLIGLPVEMAKKLNRAINATETPDSGFVLPCDRRASLPDLTFTLSGHNFTLTPDDYIWDLDAEGECMSAVWASGFPPGGPLAILGTVFLRKWYSVFDFGDNTVGFARAKR